MLNALAENANGAFLAKLPIEFPSQDETVENTAPCVNYA